MPRIIPIALQPHVRGDATTMCIVVKIVPVQPGFISFGITTLDHDITYNDGTGDLLYSAAIGSEPSNLTSSADLSVSGGESKQLMPLFDTPVDEAHLQAGAYDYAKFRAYLVNYNDLTSGNHIVLQTGTLGRNTVTDSGMAWTSELRGITQALKQSITEKWSLTCRAVFGSLVSTPQSRYPCKFDLTGIGANGTVEAVSVDDTQDFTSGVIPAVFGGAPGMVEWLTGANAGRSDESETFETVTGGVRIGLTFGASYPIQVGDTFFFRDDCAKTPTACKSRNNYQNYRGEPSIPVSDNGALSVGQIGGSVTTTTDGG